MSEFSNIASKSKVTNAAAHVQRESKQKGVMQHQSVDAMPFLQSLQNGGIQAKLSIGEPNDHYEVEADAMADRVMRMPAADPAHQMIVQKAPLAHTISSLPNLQPKCAECESQAEEQESATVQLKIANELSFSNQDVAVQRNANESSFSTVRSQLNTDRKMSPSFHLNRDTTSPIRRKEEEEDSLQKKENQNAGRGPPVRDFTTTLNQSKGSGQPLDSDTNSFMSTRFGADFSNVRIHDNSTAANLSDAINAKAFTHQNNIYFNQGQYQPNSTDGKHLLAHELTHTIQQGAVSQSVQPKLEIGGANDCYEQEADVMANKVMRMPHVNTYLGQQASIQSKTWDKEEQYNPYATVQTDTVQRTVLPSSVQSRSLSNSIQRKETRGPPTISKDNSGKIRRGFWDDPLGTIGGAISDAVSYVGDSLSAGITWVKEKLAEMARAMPGYSLFSVVIGKDPISGAHVDRNGRNFINAGLDIIPNGAEYKQKLEADGGMDTAAAWLDEQLGLLDFSVNDVMRDFGAFVDSLSLTDIASPSAALSRGIGVFRPYVDRVFTFARNVAVKLLEIVKDVAIQALLEWLQNQTPWYPLLTVVLGQDPITGDDVERNGMNILTGFISLHPEGEQQLAQMRESGSLQRAADWVDQAIARVTAIVTGLRDGVMTMWNTFSITNLLHPIDTFNQIYSLFSRPVSELVTFAIEVALMILKFIKDALIARLVEYAKTIPGYNLLTVIMGKDVFSQEPVERSMVNIIRGFMGLIPGGEEKFQELNQTGAIMEAVAWIEGAVAELDLTWAMIRGLFTTAWESFSLADLAHPIDTFVRVVELFAPPIGRMIRFVGRVVVKLIEIALRIMGFPFELIGSIISNAQQAYEEITNDPIGFLKNLLKAVKQGFVQFFSNILTHLLNGVGEWLFGQLGDTGITIPTDFSFQSILGLVFEILGITREKIFDKIKEKVGPERWAQIEGTIDTLTGVWSFVSDVLTRGPIAIWEKIQEKLTGLWDMVISAARGWIMTKIIEQVTIKLLSFLDPTGIMAVVNSFIAFFNAVQSAIEYMIPMLEMLNSFLAGIVQIAQGNIQPAADLLERTMARGMPILIGFLANQVGLGRIGAKIREVIESIQAKVDEGLQWVIDKAWEIGASLLQMGQNAIGAIVQWWRNRKNFTVEGESHAIFFNGSENNAQLTVASTPKAIDTWLNDRETELKAANEFTGAKSTSHARIKNVLVPELNSATHPPANTPSTARSVDLIMNDIVAEIQIVGIGVAGDIPVPVMAVSPGFSSNKAESLTAQFIYNGDGNHIEGTSPSDSNLATEFGLLSSMGFSHGEWVRFHLINENLGGRAVDSNLVPLTGAYNSEFHGAFERHLKDIYDGKNGRTQKPVWYNITLTYYTGVNSTWVRSINARGGAMKVEGNSWVNDRGISPWSKTNIPKPEASNPSTAPSLNGFISDPNRDINQFGRTTGIFNKTLVLLVSNGPVANLNAVEPLIDSQSGSVWTKDRKANHIAKFNLVKNANRISLKRKDSSNLKIGSPSDPLEIEADQMANKVMRMAKLPAEQSRTENRIQRKCAKCQEEETAQRKVKPNARVMRGLYRKPNSGDSGGSNTTSPSFDSQLSTTRGGGKPLDRSTKSFMENGFGTDFSGVNVHTGSKAADLNNQIQAKAFTTGSDIYFNQGEYQPSSDSGKRLIAHELTHTIQQGAVSNNVQRKCSKCEEESVQRETTTTTTTTTEIVEIEKPNEVLELKGGLIISDAMIDWLWAQAEHTGTVAVKFGSLAQGSIDVKLKQEKSKKIHTVKNPQAIEINIAALNPLKKHGIIPAISVILKDSKLSGSVGVLTVENEFFGHERIFNWIQENTSKFGLDGVEIMPGVSAKSIESKLDETAFSFGFSDIPIRLGGFLNGVFSCAFVNDIMTFKVNADVHLPLLDPTELVLNRDESGKLSGHISTGFSIQKLSGTVDIKYNSGIIDIKGEISYKDEQFDGKLSIVLTDYETAMNLAFSQLEPTEIATLSKIVTESNKAGERALVGFGVVNFKLNDQFKGRIKVILDGEGYITVIGKLAQETEIPLFDTLKPEKEYDKPLLDYRIQYGIPLLASIGIGIKMGVFANWLVNPATLRNLFVEGVYSTNPKLENNRYTIGGNLNVSAMAQAGLYLKIFGFGALLGHEIILGLELRAFAQIQGYLDAGIILGKRDALDNPEKSEYFINGSVLMAAQPSVGLSSAFFIQLDSPWWSPVPDNKWEWPLASHYFPVAEEIGLEMDIDHVIGSESWPKVNFKPHSFDPAFFLDTVTEDLDSLSVDNGDTEMNSEFKDKTDTGNNQEKPIKGKKNKKVNADDKPSEQELAAYKEVVDKANSLDTTIGSMTVETAYERIEILKRMPFVKDIKLFRKDGTKHFVYIETERTNNRQMAEPVYWDVDENNTFESGDKLGKQDLTIRKRKVEELESLYLKENGGLANGILFEQQVKFIRGSYLALFKGDIFNFDRSKNRWVFEFGPPVFDLARLMEQKLDSQKSVSMQSNAKTPNWEDFVKNGRGMNKSFIDEGGNPHEVYFKLSGRNLDMQMASSDPGDIENKIKTELEGSSAGSAGEKATLKVALKQIDTFENKMEVLLQKDVPENSEQTQALINLGVSALEVTVNLLHTGKYGDIPVPSMRVSPDFSANKASNLSAQYIYNGEGNHVEGTSPSDGNLVRAFGLLASMGYSHGEWVRFHLINENLGGRAVDSNLVPMTGANNSEFHGAFERHLKDIYNGSNGRVQKPVWYDISLIYYPGPDSDWVRSINVRGGAMKVAGNTWVNDGGVSPWSKADIPMPVASNPSTAPSLNAFILDPNRDLKQFGRTTGVFNKTLTLLVSNGPVSDLDKVELLIESQTDPIWSDVRKAKHIAKFNLVKNANRIRLKRKDSSNLNIGSPSDPLEIEADQMADQVIRMQKPQADQSLTNGDIKRKCDECNQEEGVQRKVKPSAFGMNGENIKLNTADPMVSNSSSHSFDSQLDETKGNGKPLDPTTKSFMENSFGADFSEVRIHTGSKAAALCDQIEAKAFTTGNDIYFNQGQYNPDTREGKHLLAHELTHTIQQGAGKSSEVQRKTKRHLVQRMEAAPGLELEGILNKSFQKDNVIYFDRKSSVLVKEQEDKILQFMVENIGASEIFLYGYAPDEEEGKEKSAFINDRLKVVERHLKLFSKKSTIVHSIPRPSRSKNSYIYRKFRAVEMSASKIEPGGEKGNTNTRDCNPTEIQSIDNGRGKTMANIEIAIAKIRKYQKDPSTNPAIESILNRNFKTHDSKDLERIIDTLILMKDDLNKISDHEIRRCATTDHHICAKAHAFASGSEIVTFCPKYFDEKESTQQRIVLHEMGHFIKLNLDDRAYSHNRAFKFLSTEEALVNTDSFAILVQELSGTLRLSKDVNTLVDPSIDTISNCGADQKIVEVALAWAQRWNGLLDQGLRLTYSDPNYFKEMVGYITKNFGPVNPYSLPGMIDRNISLSKIYKKGIRFNCSKIDDSVCKSGGPVNLSWFNVFMICPSFFALGETERIVQIGAEIARLVTAIPEKDRLAYSNLGFDYKTYFWKY